MRLTWNGGGAAGGVLVALAVGFTAAAPQGTRPREPRSSLPIESTTEGEECVAGRVLLRLERPLPPELVAALQHHGVSLEDQLDGGIDVLHVPEGVPPDLVAAAFEELPEVAFSEPDRIVRCEAVVNDSLAGSQWHLAKVRAPEAWDVSEGAAHVMIAIVDTGIDPLHPDLSGKLVRGWNFVRNNGTTDDDHGHGTHVAGIAAASTDNGFGVAGVGFRCSLMPVKVLDAAGVGSYAAVAAGIRFASTHGAKVVNLSLGGNARSAALEAAIDAALARGALVVASAGNRGTTEPQYPAHYAEALAVGASLPNDARASFSTFGAWVDVAAPGSSILSTFPMAPVSLGSAPNGFETMSGTSMAAPVVSGIAGLLYGYLGASASPAAVRALIESTADPVATPWTAFGRVDAAAALARAAQPFTPRTGTVRNVNITIGRYKAGDVTSLVVADSSSLEIAPEGTGRPRLCEMEIDVSGLTGTLVALELRVEGRSSAAVRQVIQAFDWASETFEAVDVAVQRPRGTVRRVDLSSRASAFVRGGILRLRVQFRAPVAYTAGVDAVSVSGTGG